MKDCKKYYSSNKKWNPWLSYLGKTATVFTEATAGSLLHELGSVRHSSTHRPANANNNPPRGQQFISVLNSTPQCKKQHKKRAISSLSILCKSLHFGNLQQYRDKQRVILYGKEKQIVFLLAKKTAGVSRTSSTRQTKRQTQRDLSSSAIHSLPAELS